MQLKFTKMQGCGNDYIYIHCFEQKIDDLAALAIALSDRHFGIGGDGVVLICPPSPSVQADAKMRMFNLDGSEGKMCGNAIRCVGKYLYDNHIVQKLTMRIETLSGIKTLKLTTRENVVSKATVDMGQAELIPAKIPVDIHMLEDAQGFGQKGMIVDQLAIINERDYRITCVSMGNPHCVVFLDETQRLENLDIAHIGSEFEKAPLFPERVNTEFVKVIDDHTLKMRVWERGSGETLACGTGACAAVVAAALNGYCKKQEDIRVILSGGELVINYSDDCVLMTGSCEKVFEGVITR